MADIRIKDLATTASVTASDDFMAVDGVTNGTRKLSAATPAFLTSVTTPSLTSPASTNLTLAGGAGNSSIILTPAGTGNVGIGTTSPSDKFVVSNAGAEGLEIGATSLVIVQAYNRSGSAYVDYRDQCLNRIFYTNGNTQALTLSSTQAATFAGAVTVSTGNLIIGTAGNGIDFSADPSAAGMTSELLDDYEEGTWTPSIGGTATYTTQVGSYTKIGRQVTLWFDLTINVLGTGSTQFISGVPFVPASLVGYHSGTVYWESIAINEIALNVVCQESTGTIWFIGKSAAGASVDNQVAVIGTGARFRGTLTYNV